MFTNVHLNGESFYIETSKTGQTKMSKSEFSHDAFIRDLKKYCSSSPTLEKLGVIRLILSDVISDYRSATIRSETNEEEEMSCNLLHFFDNINDEIRRLQLIDVQKLSMLVGTRKD